jgi:hypothetical protein
MAAILRLELTGHCFLRIHYSHRTFSPYFRASLRGTKQSLRMQGNHVGCAFLFALYSIEIASCLAMTRVRVYRTQAAFTNKKIKLIKLKFVAYKNNINTHYEKIKFYDDVRAIGMDVSGM